MDLDASSRQGSYCLWDLDLPELKEIRDWANIYKYKKGTTLFCPDVATDDVLIIKSGWLRSYLISEDGRELTLLIFGPKSMLCEFVLFSLHPFQTFAQAMEDIEVFRVKKKRLEELLTQNPEIMIRAWRAMTAKIQAVLGRMRSLLFDDLNRRVLEAISLLSTCLIRASDKDGEIEIAVTHEELASLTAASRTAVTGCLAELARAGAISVSRGKVILPRPVKGS
ncbi:MAG: Crp/Fnr family transcriptional regulator [Firmicutes bacterium]|nr:Crp/Fnr family transcriptional regulator [Bacillota bacterium]MCL5039739.1 Crp/Fnr family transcriptional regulator [Bacillota bacterium]